MWFLVFLQLFLGCAFYARVGLAIAPYDFPAIPSHFPPLDHAKFATNFSDPFMTQNTTKHVPRIVWVSFKTRPESLDDIGFEMVDVITQARKDGWTVYCLGHVEQILFMELYYPETSILWAIKSIHPNAGASVSDIWRVAAVHAFGGLYLDDDSSIRAPLEEVVEPTDRFIIGREPQNFHDHCYHKQFHLSGPAMTKTYNSTDWYSLFGSKRFLQWIFIAEPRHRILRRILENMAEVIRLEYLGGFSMYRLPKEAKWKLIICATGPDIWTSTIREMVMKKELLGVDDPDWRVLNKHGFVEYQANFKNSGTKHYQARLGQHYARKMHTNLLSSYAPFNLSSYEHWPVSDGGRTFYYIDKGVRRAIPDYDTYTMMGFSFEDNFLIGSEDLNSIPLGDAMPAISDQ